MEKMIPHALFRNLIIPTTIFFYLLYYQTRNKHIEALLRYTSWLTFYLVPLYILAAILGLNPITWIIKAGWRSPQSPIQYLLYITAAKHFNYLKTRNFPYSYTAAIITAGAAGYLHEVPYWLANNIDVFRTAHYSPTILDWGMLSAMILVASLFLNRLAYPKLFLATLALYLGYCYVYYYHYDVLRGVLVALLPIMPVVARRTPAMLLTLLASLQLRPSQARPDTPSG